MRLMTVRKLFGTAATIAVLALSSGAFASTIATWTFETSIPVTAGPHAAEVGTGSALGSHSNAGVVYSNPSGNGSVESFSSNFWTTGDYYQFSASSTSLSNIGISWDENRSSTGPDGFEVQYSTGGPYVAIPTNPGYTIPGGIAWTSGTPDVTGTTSFKRNLASIAALNNAATIAFRLVQTSATGGTAGTNRVDNFRISAGEVPEPSTLVFGCLIGLALVGIGHRATR